MAIIEHEAELENLRGELVHYETARKKMAEL
jgi:hypothetical protein